MFPYIGAIVLMIFPVHTLRVSDHEESSFAGFHAQDELMWLVLYITFATIAYLG